MKILVVDDEEDARILFEQRFRKEVRSGAVELSFAYSGEEALEFLKVHESETILILSDINMPGMTGIQLLKRIRANHPTPPPTIMMITAYNDKESEEEAMQFGADDYLHKPLDFIDLKHKLHLE
jgi:CheY-like chemotaxis protein